MNFYLTQRTQRNWSGVESGPHASKEAVKSAALEMIHAASSEEDMAIILSLHAMSSTKRVGKGKSLRNDWIEGQSELADSEDIDIRTAMADATRRCGLLGDDDDADEFTAEERAALDAELLAEGW